MERPLDQQQAASVDLNSEQLEMETHTEGDGEGRKSRHWEGQNGGEAL